MKQSIDLHLLSNNLQLPPLKVSFSLVTDTVIRMQVTNDDGKGYKVPKSVNEDYINDPERKINIHIDDVIKFSEPGERFYYEIH